MDRQDRTSRDKTQVTPQPSDPDLFAWIEKLFEGTEQKPESIEVLQAYGPGARKYGASVIRPKEWKTNAPKPNREQMVAISNEFLHAAQLDCNKLGRPHHYRVVARNFFKNDKYYATYLIKCTPKQAAGEDYDGGGDGAEGLDEDGIMTDAKRRDLLMNYQMEVLKEGQEHRRWEQEQFAQSMGGVMGHHEKIIGMLMEWNQQLRTELSNGDARRLDYFKVMEEAISKKAEREMAAEDFKFKQGLKEKGLNFLLQMFPVAVNKIANKSVIPTSASSESLAVKSFLDTITVDQGKVIFGVLNEANTDFVTAGILNKDQIMILHSVADCSAPPSALNLLFEGENAITQDQIMKISQVLSPDQLMPLMAFASERMKAPISSTPPTNTNS